MQDHYLPKGRCDLLDVQKLIRKKTDVEGDDISQVGRSGVDRVPSFDAQGAGFEPRPLRFKKYHFFTPKP